MPVLDVFDRRLMKLEPRERAYFLHGVYRQIVPSRKGRPPRKGLYNGAIKSLGEQERHAFLVYLAHNLRVYGLKHHSHRVLEHFGLSEDDTIRFLQDLEKIYAGAVSGSSSRTRTSFSR